MFDISGHKTMIKDLHNVVNNKFVLFNDGENDLIYTGTNPYGNRVLCCIMFDDDEREFLRYSHILTTEVQYNNFINKKISLLEILKENQSFFIVDFNYALKEIDFNIVSIDDIPTDFLPLESSYCPDFIFNPTFNYSVSMQGGIADEHKTTSKSLNSISTSFTEFLKASTEFINDLDLGREVYINALATGSFKVNFNIEIKEPEQISIMELPSSEINQFLNNYFGYVFNNLPSENENIFQTPEVESESFKVLEHELQQLYDKKSATPQDGVEHKLIDLINYSINNLKDIDYSEGFERLSFMNISTEGDYIPFAMIDNNLISSIQQRLFDTSEFIESNVINKDENQVEYTFQVYQFNIDTGNGRAYYTNPGGSVIKIAVHAKGRNNYQNTGFTKSMDENKPYKFKGIGIYVNSVLKNITINLD